MKDTANGIQCITIGGTFCRRSGGAAATSKYAPPEISGHNRKSHFGTPLENGKIVGDIVIGTTIDAITATPARNRTLRCTDGSRSFATGKPNSVPGADCGSPCAMLSSAW